MSSPLSPTIEELDNIKELKQGFKADKDKPRWDLLPVDAVRQVVIVLTHGANKYADRNWEKGLLYSRCYAATMRHMTSWWEGEENDPETGINHLAHAICELLFALAFSLRGMKDFDDRPK